MAVSLLALLAAHAACPEREPLLDRAEEDVAAQFLPDAQRGLEAFVEALACGEPVSAVHHRRYWQAVGVAWSYATDPRAAVALRSSRDRDPTWNDAYYGTEGAERDLWASEAVGRPAKVDVEGVGPREVVWVDGEPALPPLELSGAHLLQVGDASGARFATALIVDGPTTVRVPGAPGLLETAGPAEPTETAPSGPALRVVRERTVDLDVAGDVCAREDGGKRCEPVVDGRYTVSARSGLAVLDLEGDTVGRQLVWVDDRPPESGEATALVRREGVEIVVVGAEDDGWIAGWRVARDKACTDVLQAYERLEPRLRLDAWPGEAWVCAVDGAGNVGQATRVRPPAHADAPLDHVLQDQLAYVVSGVVGHGVTSGAACTSTEPACGRFVSATLPLRPPLSPSSRPHTLFTRLQRPDRLAVRHFLYDDTPPEVRDVRVIRTVDGATLVLQGRDAASGIAGWRVGWGSRAPHRCASADRAVPAVRPFVQTPPEAALAWVCAEDLAGNTSEPRLVRLD